jgi:hypothetical protein
VPADSPTGTHWIEVAPDGYVYLPGIEHPITFAGEAAAVAATGDHVTLIDGLRREVYDRRTGDLVEYDSGPNTVRVQHPESRPLKTEPNA